MSQLIKTTDKISNKEFKVKHKVNKKIYISNYVIKKVESRTKKINTKDFFSRI